MAGTRIESATPRKILAVSGNPDVREGWARYFEARGLDVIRCAGPKATHCALERGEHCPLLNEADAAYYDNECVTADLAADLVKHPRVLPIFIADDTPTSAEGHVPEVSRAI